VQADAAAAVNPAATANSRSMRRRGKDDSSISRS
jgi:hypothetical protein